MISISRLRVVIHTVKGLFGFDEKLNTGLSFISSYKNTSGKSSVIEAIYYGLGFEEILGGKGDKVLTSAYKTQLVYLDDEVVNVLESGVYLEISNGISTIVVYRAAKHNTRKHNLVTVYFCDIDNLSKASEAEDMYVVTTNAAEHEKGFHNFLEKFIGFSLPYVTTTDDIERKLYLQLIFSCMFIEQKHGWSDLFSGMPYLGIKDARKRVVEFILDLDTFQNEKVKEALAIESNRIKKEWRNIVNDCQIHAERELCIVKKLEDEPYLSDNGIDSDIQIFVKSNELVAINDFIRDLIEDQRRLNSIKPKVVDNFDELNEELQKAESAIIDLSDQVNKAYLEIRAEETIVSSLTESIELIEQDLVSNKDAKKLKDLGSQIECSFSNNRCPVCNQIINDSLMYIPETHNTMSIEENIKHLQAQKDTLQFSLSSHQEKILAIKNMIDSANAKIVSFRRLTNSIRADLFSLNDNYSESLVYKKIENSNKLSDLNQLRNYIDERIKLLSDLSDQWGKYLDKKSKLPKDKFSDKDKEKLLYFRGCFIRLLRMYGYRSVNGIENIVISPETYLPTIENFDLKFDSSASDNIRAIWAYTLALLYTSKKFAANHPGIVIFDEPFQHSIINEDIPNLFQSIIDLGNEAQVIIAITIRDAQTDEYINGLPKGKYSQIDIGDHAFIQFARIKAKEKDKDQDKEKA